MAQDADVFPAGSIHVFFQDDLILGQSTGFIGTQDVHLAKGLDGTQMFDDRLFLAHGNGALGQRRSDHDR